MNLHRSIIWCCCYALLAASALQTCVYAQSSLIKMPGDNNDLSEDSSTKPKSLFPTEPPNDLPKALRRTEHLLTKPLPDQLVGRVYWRDFINGIREMGVTATLDISAEDTMTLETEFEVPAPGDSINTNLQLALKRYDCAHTITRTGVVNIMSVDASEYALTRVTFDVTGISNDAYELANVLKNTISSDDWEDNGGMNRLSVYQANNRDFMTMAVAYKDLQEIRRYFAGLNHIAGNSNGQLSSRFPASSVVQLPLHQQGGVRRQQRAFVTSVIPVVDGERGQWGRPGSYGGGIGGSGIGGGGLGGGIF